MTNTNETEPVGVRRLREARASLAARQAEQQPEAESAPLPLKPGDQFHAVMTGCTFSTGGGFLASSHVSTAGETYTVTQQLIDASRDRYGDSWLIYLASDEAQIQKWGAVRFRLGPAPEGIATWNQRGDADWTQQREAAKAEAWGLPTAEARAAALAAVDARFGPAVTTATYSKYTDPSIALAEAQQHALNTGGVRFSQHVEAREAGAER
ncbi:hypothetical protein ABS642_05155 [Microbacterium sp. A8/3-1]|uniref:Uncharacterized protein n=1 Tax=Microbacterium sp. A8/3-1 TaxID=3160749 RepID=A0AAU7VYI3_9MICO